MTAVHVAGVDIARGLAVRRMDAGAEPAKADLLVPGEPGLPSLGIALVAAVRGRLFELETDPGAVCYALAGARFSQHAYLVAGSGGRLVPAAKGEITLAIARGRGDKPGQLVPVEIARVGERAP